MKLMAGLTWLLVWVCIIGLFALRDRSVSHEYRIQSLETQLKAKESK